MLSPVNMCDRLQQNVLQMIFVHPIGTGCVGMCNRLLYLKSVGNCC